eukprot:TRINITY_DN9612_c0_g1_i2.p1 TRINITY_DN9612_c0_g1~~TRINITY_DN9612_c0_g1_i2.p1  ORF type:complete len:141 (+),score=21.75 TRINITY_DN9612_c0_g1_i2:180-602(+)
MAPSPPSLHISTVDSASKLFQRLDLIERQYQHATVISLSLSLSASSFPNPISPPLSLIFRLPIQILESDLGISFSLFSSFSSSSSSFDCFSFLGFSMECLFSVSILLILFIDFPPDWESVLVLSMRMSDGWLARIWWAPP